ncbi:hypothetical protein Dda_7286 [Drechslerella dactyloides]|uniref:Uncharacterized protein n=1 Tax=Drechslerella dactyloides TaxID=74499 RepID=A0AAD6NFG0_DREDA|nr:hypothetical protein Dda_7286 [Drechslerella dactyloides]
MQWRDGGGDDDADSKMAMVSSGWIVCDSAGGVVVVPHAANANAAVLAAGPNGAATSAKKECRIGIVPGLRPL